MKLKQSGLQTTTALHASDYCSVLNPLFVCTSYYYWFLEAHHIRLLLCVGIKVVDEWQISLDYVHGSNIYVRGYLDLRAWSLRLRA